jgi:hypothetical protein
LIETFTEFSSTEEIGIFLKDNPSKLSERFEQTNPSVNF